MQISQVRPALATFIADLLRQVPGLLRTAAAVHVPQDIRVGARTQRSQGFWLPLSCRLQERGELFVRQRQCPAYRSVRGLD